MIRIRPEVSGLLDTGDIDGVAAALQIALELEHATIPPYLYAKWSLGSGSNSDLADIIDSVILEEMRHMAIVANILNALGRPPVFDSPSFLPHYPGPLPGTVEHDLQVGLAPFSLVLAENTFMVIEQPENPLEFAAEFAAAPKTIGEFYRDIRTAIGNLGASAFTGPAANQMPPSLVSGVVVVTDAVTATKGIDQIIDQGEGTETSPGEVVGTDFAHYYRFAEIVKGHKLVPNPAAGPSAPPDQQFTYTGDAINFVPAEVFAVPVNPTKDTYPAGSADRQACDEFNVAYTGMLKTLQVAFTGQPSKVRGAVNAMFSLQTLATQMMSGAKTGTPVGPTFEWQEASA